MDCCLCCSVQDTAVCLLAITRYVVLTFSKDQNTVTISSEESNEIFQVNGDNRLLVQRSELTKARGQYTVDVEGQGCTFIQVIEIYLRRRRMIASKRVRLFSYRWSGILPFCIFPISCLLFHWYFPIDSWKWKLFYEEILTFKFNWVTEKFLTEFHRQKAFWYFHWITLLKILAYSEN